MQNVFTMRSLRSKIRRRRPSCVRCAYPNPSFSSCVLIECGDVDSINATQRRREIRFSAGRSASTRTHLRAPAARIRGGEALHTGCVFRSHKHFPDGGEILLAGRRARRRGDTVLSDVAPEVESLLVLKNNRGVGRQTA